MRGGITTTHVRLTVRAASPRMAVRLRPVTLLATSRLPRAQALGCSLRLPLTRGVTPPLPLSHTLTYSVTFTLFLARGLSLPSRPSHPFPSLTDQTPSDRTPSDHRTCNKTPTDPNSPSERTPLICVTVRAASPRMAVRLRPVTLLARTRPPQAQALGCSLRLSLTRGVPPPHSLSLSLQPSLRLSPFASLSLLSLSPLPPPVPVPIPLSLPCSFSLSSPPLSLSLYSLSLSRPLSALLSSTPSPQAPSLTQL